MKRDVNLVRKILFALEAIESYDDPVKDLLEEESRESISYHVLIMTEGGLIESIEQTKTFNSRACFYATRLTWEGHEFLDASRNDNIWNKALSEIGTKGGSFTLDIVKGLLLFYAKKQLGI